MNLKGLLTSNVQLKLLSLLLAALLWLFVAAETVDEISIPYAVNYVNVPAGFAVKTVDTSGSRVSIEGARILLLRQKIKGVTVNYDLAGSVAGVRYQLDINRSVKLMRGVTAVDVSPARIEFELLASR